MYATILLSSLAAAASLRAPPTYTNPTSPGRDTPDPGVAFDNATGLWWASTTTGGAPCFSLSSSHNLADWVPAGHMFDTPPAWADPANPSCWAPELHQVNGSWVAYFVARSKRSGLLSLGVATSQMGPGGPWTDSGAPLVEDSGAGAQGQIDATLARGPNGALFLVFKEDGNADGLPTPIHMARLTDNGTALRSGAAPWKGTQLIRDSLPWEHGITEAPWVVAQGGFYYLFYSGSGYTNEYAVGVARAQSLGGPYEKRAWRCPRQVPRLCAPLFLPPHPPSPPPYPAVGEPILRQDSSGAGAPPFESPGHCSVVQAADGKWAMVYHAWVGNDRSARHMMLDEVVWGADGWPRLATGGYPSTTAQPVP